MEQDTSNAKEGEGELCNVLTMLLTFKIEHNRICESVCEVDCEHSVPRTRLTHCH